MTQEALNPPNDKELPILEHLDELRKHVMWAALGLGVGTIASFIFAVQIFRFLMGCNFSDFLISAETIANSCPQTQFGGVTGSIEIYFQIALTAGAILSMPWILLQFWRFITPGLLPREKRYVYIFVPFAFILFLAGVAFAWYILLPPALTFLSTFLVDAAENVKVEWEVNSYIDFITGFLFWMGVAFEMPLIFYFLARFGIVTPALLKESWRFAIVGIAILAAVITPSIDPVTMLLTMVPLTFLYLFSIGMTSIGQRQFLRRADNP